MQCQIPIFPLEVPHIVTWQHISDWLKTHGGSIATVIIIFGAFFGVMRYTINSEVADIRADVNTLKRDNGTFTADLTSTNQKIDGLLKEALERAFPRPANKSETRGSLKDANGILQLAKNQKIKLNPELIADYGKRVAALSSEPDVSDAAWRTLTTLLNYRAFLNTDFSPANFEFMSQRRGPQETMELEADVKGTIHFTYLNTFVPGNQTFVYQRLDNKKSLDYGHPYLRVTGTGGVRLDGFQLRNVIFEGVSIEYKGGPIQLGNVYFVNCTFDVQHTSQGQEFAKATLSHVPVTFQTATHS